MENNKDKKELQVSPYTMADFAGKTKIKSITSLQLDQIAKIMNARAIMVVGIRSEVAKDGANPKEFNISTLRIHPDKLVGMLDFVSEILKKGQKKIL